MAFATGHNQQRCAALVHVACTCTLSSKNKQDSKMMFANLLFSFGTSCWVDIESSSMFVTFLRLKPCAPSIAAIFLFITVLPVSSSWSWLVTVSRPVCNGFTYEYSINMNDEY